MRILFITKKNETYGFKSYTKKSSGLYNSTRFIVEALLSEGIDARIVEVVDNNSIDKEVDLFRPQIVVIEALWVVPEKFPILMKLHPKVRWYCHMHSGLPFLAQEGMAMDWLARYAQLGVGIIANSEETYKDYTSIFRLAEVRFLPNVYLAPMLQPIRHKHSPYVNIACFGAIRPLKNQLIQAMAAIRFAREKGLRLKFHINATRVEVGGDPVLKNLRELFKHHPEHKLVEHPWMEPEDLIDFMHKHIDIGLQVSLTETFNVITADYVASGLPMVVSKEVNWASWFNKAIDDSIDDITERMHWVWGKRLLVKWNQYLLKVHTVEASELWKNFVLNYSN